MANTIDQLQSSADTAAGGSSISIEMQLTEQGRLSAVNVNGDTVIDKTVANAAEVGIPYTGNMPLDRLLNALIDTWHTFVEHLPVLALSLLVLILTNGIASGVRVGVKRLMMRFGVRRGMCDVAGNLSYLLLWLGGILIAILVYDPSVSISRIVTIVGLLSLALSFIFRDIMENFFAGMLLMWQFPFENGDFIEIETDNGTIAGEVVDVQLRMTMIREISNELMVVPNASIYNAPLRVDTWKPLRRDTLRVQIAYEESISEAREVLIKAVESCELVQDKVEVRVFADRFADSGCEFLIAWWAKSTPLEMWLAKDQVMEAVKTGLDEAGIEIPYPHRKLIGVHREDEPSREQRPPGKESTGKKKAPDDSDASPESANSTDSHQSTADQSKD